MLCVLCMLFLIMNRLTYQEMTTQKKLLNGELLSNIQYLRKLEKYTWVSLFLGTITNLLVRSSSEIIETWLLL